MRIEAEGRARAIEVEGRALANNPQILRLKEIEMQKSWLHQPKTGIMSISRHLNPDSCLTLETENKSDYQ